MYDRWYAYVSRANGRSVSSSSGESVDARLDEAKATANQARSDSKIEINDGRSSANGLETIRESGELPPLRSVPQVPPLRDDSSPRRLGRQMRDRPDTPPRNPARLQQSSSQQSPTGHGLGESDVGSAAHRPLVNASGTNPGHDALSAARHLSRGNARGLSAPRPRNAAHSRRGIGRQSTGASQTNPVDAEPEQSGSEGAAPADGQPGPSSVHAPAADDEFST